MDTDARLGRREGEHSVFDPFGSSGENEVGGSSQLFLDLGWQVGLVAHLDLRRRGVGGWRLRFSAHKDVGPYSQSGSWLVFP